MRGCRRGATLGSSRQSSHSSKTWIARHSGPIESPALQLVCVCLPRFECALGSAQLQQWLESTNEFLAAEEDEEANGCIEETRAASVGGGGSSRVVDEDKPFVAWRSRIQKAALVWGMLGVALIVGAEDDSRRDRGRESVSKIW